MTWTGRLRGWLRSERASGRASIAVVVVIAVLATLYRFPLLDSVPPGLNFDEGGEGVAALDVWNGHYRIWWPIGGGKEPLMAYAMLVFFNLFGVTRLALRAYDATLGVLGVLACYWLAREMFRAPGQQSRYVPAMSALGLAFLFCHVNYSRIGFRAFSMPAVETAALALMWRALNRVDTPRRWWYFGGAGFFVGLGAYTYLAGRFVPVGIALFFAAEAVVARVGRRRPLLLRFRRELALMVGVAVLVFAPLGAYFATHPAAFLERAGSVSIFNPDWNHGDLRGTLARTLAQTLGTFVGATGDPLLLSNIPGRPMLGPVQGALFLLGVAVSIRRLKEPAYLFLLAWWPVMLLPGVLAPENPPHHLRIIGSWVGAVIFVAVGLWAALEWAEGLLQKRGAQKAARYLCPVVVVVFYLLVAWRTYHDYFRVWADSPGLYMAFDVYAEELADEIVADDEPGVVYVIPMDLRAAHEARHYSLDFLYVSRGGQTPYHYLVVDENTIAGDLTAFAEGKRVLRVVSWKEDKHVEADAREMVRFLLATGAEFAGARERRVYRVETYLLPTDHARFELPRTTIPSADVFGGVLRLNGVGYTGTVHAGDPVAAVLGWERIGEARKNYKVSLRLVDSGGKLIAQKDRSLMHNWHQGVTGWAEGEPVNEYYLLELPEDAPAGEYRLLVLVYDPDTLEPLGPEVELGRVFVDI